MPLPLTTRSNGQTIDQTWFNLINDELVTIDGKHSALVDNGALMFKFHHDIAYLDGITNVAQVKLTQAITILSAQIGIEVHGASGNLEIDVKFKRGAGAWTSIFQTVPKIPFGAGDGSNSDTGAGATAAVIDSTYDELLADDLLRIDFLDAPPNTATIFPRNCYIQIKRENTGA